MSLETSSQTLKTFLLDFKWNLMSEVRWSQCNEERDEESSRHTSDLKTFTENKLRHHKSPYVSLNFSLKRFSEQLTTNEQVKEVQRHFTET